MTDLETGMLEVNRDVRVGPDDVFAVLADGWTYSAWVVGNTRIREVDPGWPAEGTRLHHSTGAWPLQFQDVTTVRSVQPGRLLELDARVWLLGNVIVRFTLEPLPDGGTRIGMAERAVTGWAGKVPVQIQALAWRPRNVETLSRLADLAVGRAT